MLLELAAMVAADSDAKELDRQRILLCITKADIETIQRETCGRLFQTVSLSYCDKRSRNKLRLAGNSDDASGRVYLEWGKQPFSHNQIVKWLHGPCCMRLMHP